MPYPPNYHFVRQSVTGSGSGESSVTMADQNAGDLLIAVMASVAASLDFTTLPTSIQDTIGNTYNLAYTMTGNNTTSAVYNCVAIYVCDRANGAGGYTLDMPAAMIPADVANTWIYLLELQTTYAYNNFTVAGYVATSTVDFALATSSAPASGYDGAIIAFVADSASAANPVLSTYLNALSAFGTVDNDWGWQEDSILNGNEHPSTAVLINGATDAFGFIVALQGSNAQGNSAQGSAAFWISKGPNPTVPNEGRAVATCEIDCTNMQMVPMPLNFDEFSTSDGSEFNGAISVEFDLQRLNMSLGKGFSECKSVAFYYRPCYNNGEDFNLVNVYPALITNLTTRQTVVCWGDNVSAGNDTFGVTMVNGIAPFQCNVNAMKVRVLIPQFGTTPYGKLTLQFFNYDVAPYAPLGLTLGSD